MEEKRVLFAIFLIFLVLYVYQALLPKPAPKPGVVPSPAATNVGSADQRAAAEVVKAPGAATSPAPASSPASATHNLVGDERERDVTVETPDLIAVFTNRGARLKSWRLKRYLNPSKEPLELVSTDIEAGQPLPFTLQGPDDKVTASLNAALYAVRGPDASGTSTRVAFDYEGADGLRAVKEFDISSPYVIGFRAQVTSGSPVQAGANPPAGIGQPVPVSILWGPAIGDSEEASRYAQKPEGLLFNDGKAQRLSAKDLTKQSTYTGDFRYAGVDDHYFMTVALSTGPAKINYQPLSIPPPPGSKDAARDLVSYSLDPGKAGEPEKFFFGPKDFDVLASIDRDLTRAINFGMFAFLVVPLLKSLKWVNGYLGNYGWSIIVLTIIINAVMFPLRHKSVVSMRKMQEIQPEVKAIQDRYSKLKVTDPAKQKMNQELMTLYREKGVNPASGCVPMLLTMPVLFAFYSLLSVSIELRGAPFFGWIHDLSAHDPLYITPVLMGVSQLWQQRMTPAAGMDPAQQKMMMVMPIVFTFMFLWAPAGLAVYWLISNLWAIGQQYATNYLIGPPKVHAVRPAAERRVKRVGGGKTEAAAREN
jgi:YidC/Oxa1 family membrane protein insertase